MSKSKIHDDTLSVEDDPASLHGRGDPVLFLAFRCDQLATVPHRFSLAGVNEVLFGRGDEPPRLADGVLNMSIADPRMSLPHARVTRDGNGFMLRDLQSKNGSVVNGVRVDDVTLADGDLIELGGTFLVF